MDNLLALLKRLEWVCIYDRYGDRSDECPECRGEDYAGHDKSCELKAMIDKLEKEQKEKV